MNFLKLFSLATGLCILSLGQAFATPVDFQANSSYNTSNDSVYVAFLEYGGQTVRLTFNWVGTFQTGNAVFDGINGTLFDTLTQTGSLTLASAFNVTTNTALAANLSGSLNTSYTNVNVSGDGSAMNSSGNGIGVFSFNGTLDGQTISATVSNLMSMNGNLTLGQLGGYFDPAINIFGNNEILNTAGAFWADAEGIATHLIGWHSADASGLLNGQNFNFHLSADMHGGLVNPTSVPEPTTVGLLISGLLGGAAKRRKKVVA